MLEQALLAHFARYPAMLPQDAVKLLYQSVWGAGHLLGETKRGITQLNDEMNTIKADAQQTLVEPIGFGMCRVNIAALNAMGIGAGTVYRAFALDAQQVMGDECTFLDALDCLRLMSERGKTPFSAEECRAYIAQYRIEGCPMVSHTERYKHLYRPAYRVMSERIARFLPLFSGLDERLAQKQSVVLAIDGPCGSGKTTLAGILERMYGSAVISMDSFFLPQVMRTQERLEQPGGNVHYERFMEEAAEGLLSGRTFSYRPFDCKMQAYGQTVTVQNTQRLRVVEGSYSMHPALFGLYDCTVFLTITPEEQCKRLALRESPESLLRFCEIWIPLENRYFEAYAVQKRCQYLF